MNAKTKTHVVAAILFLAFVLLAALSAEGAQDPWKILDGFTPLPDQTARLGEHYIAVLYANRGEQLLAVVIFKAICVERSCELEHRAAYAVVNADGANTHLYVDPAEKELIGLIGQIT